MKKTKGLPRLAPAQVQLKAISEAAEETQRRVFDAIALARREPDLSLPKAARFSGTTVKTIQRHAAGALERRGGRIKVKPTDQLTRRVRLLTSRGVIDVTARDSETASLIAEHWNAVRTYVRTSDYQPLEQFILRFVHVEDGDFEFLTHRPTLNKLVRAGALHFQDIYASSGRF